MKQLVQLLRWLAVVLAIVGVGLGIVPRTASALLRPTPMGVSGSNSSINWNAAHQRCFEASGTLGALVADQNGTQYILSNAHVLAMGPTGIYATGSAQPIDQPYLFSVLSTCSQLTASVISAYQVGTLSTVVPLTFADNVANPTDAAIAQVINGSASSSIQGISNFSGTPLTVLKKGLVVQMVGAESGQVTGEVITKMFVTEGIKGCQHLPTSDAETVQSCGWAEKIITNLFEVKTRSGKAFAKDGDSGALVLTTGACPQPVGLLIGGTSSVALVGEIDAALSALQSYGGYSSLSIVPGGTGCTTSTAEVEDVDGNTSSVDPTVADPDVTQALGARSNLMNYSYVTDLINDGTVLGVAVDLSGSTATLDITVDSAADLANLKELGLLPTSFEGVAVTSDVINVLDSSSDTSGLQSLD